MNLMLSKWAFILSMMGLFAVITAPAPVDAQRRTAQIVKKEAVEAFKAKDYRQAAILFQELWLFIILMQKIITFGIST